MNYKTCFAAPALADMDGIMHYITFVLKNPTAAGDFYNTCLEKLNILCKSPRIYPLSRIKKLADKGYRRFEIGNYIVLYKIDEEGRTVYIMRIFYQKQDYKNLL